MLIKTISSLLFMFIPIICFGFEDSCTNPKDYTIDRRCYVSDETWAKLPHKYVLKMYDKEIDLVFCAANMVSGKIVTAQHCFNDRDLKNVEFIAFDGTIITAEKLNIYTDEWGFSPDFWDDWAVLTPKPEFKSFVTDNSIYNIKDISNDSQQTYITIGCGGLKILSDEEIEKFKNTYTEFLKNNTKYKESSAFGDFTDEATVDITTAIMKHDFLEDIEPYLQKTGMGTSQDIFVDSNNLKLSVCDTALEYEGIEDKNWGFSRCQSWHGNSGGGMYGVPRTQNIQSGISCKAPECEFFGVFTIGRSLISTDPKMHTGGKIIFSLPSEQFKSYLDSE